MPRNYRRVQNNLEVKDEKNLSIKLRLTQNAVLMDTVKSRLTDAATSTVPEILLQLY
nr:hypothetical protein [uncultured Treponema sp.]